ncbi:gibberellin 3-beta-dioxygenase 1 [Cajanus cajan]|uniref:gibberellin 3beta-dioxygenase n=1 Tax=Cajanus cajan TaxID=3821 RepID=A0A151RAH7_CAJCA|nr:gibberellin 3-beta-dioxygenase 1 [Cajanus cajan]KYP39561.1 Gibberellin 3-beta-dioxygenase 1 [Cajanus cajan]
MESALGEAYKEHPIHLGHIVPLDFSSLPTLPDSHAWSPSNDDYSFPCNDASSSIPIIDLMDPNAMHLIGHACETWGAFQVKNHGIPFGVIERVEQEAKRLFSLPTQQKLKALRSPGGATGYGRARISQFFHKFMWHEGFTIIGSPSHDVKKIWPNDYAHFCDLMEKYEKEMKVLAERLTKMMLELLGIREEKRKWVGSKNTNGAVQLNFYPSCPEPKRAMGLAPHTDTSLFTILHQTQTTGLEIFKEGKGWVPVHPHPNALVVNTGDFFHIMSNARFRCALHRVTVNRTRKRYSVAYFYYPPMDYEVSPFDLNSAARFRPVTVKEYNGIKAKNFGQALSLISTSN